MKTKIYSFLVVFSLLLLSTSCVRVQKTEEPPSLIGTWITKNNNFQIEMRFKEDKTTSVTVFDLSQRNSEQVYTIGTWEAQHNILTTTYTRKYTRSRTEKYIINKEVTKIDVNSTVPFLLSKRVLRLKWNNKPLSLIKRLEPTKDDSKVKVDQSLLSYSE